MSTKSKVEDARTQSYLTKVGLIDWLAAHIKSDLDWVPASCHKDSEANHLEDKSPTLSLSKPHSIIDLGTIDADNARDSSGVFSTKRAAVEEAELKSTLVGVVEASTPL
jgi:hypothetical protein